MEFQFKKLVPNLDTTNLTVDPALAVVGSLKDADEAQPTRPKRESSFSAAVHSVRSFSEEEKLVEHIDTEHFME